MTDYFENIAKFNNFAPKSNTDKSEELKLIEFSMKTKENFETILPESLQHMKNDIINKNLLKLNKTSNNDTKIKNENPEKVLIMPLVSKT